MNLRQVNDFLMNGEPITFHELLAITKAQGMKVNKLRCVGIRHNVDAIYIHGEDSLTIEYNDKSIVNNPGYREDIKTIQEYTLRVMALLWFRNRERYDWSMAGLWAQGLTADVHYGIDLG